MNFGGGDYLEFKTGCPWWAKLARVLLCTWSQ